MNNKYIKRKSNIFDYFYFDKNCVKYIYSSEEVKIRSENHQYIGIQIKKCLK